MRRWPLLYVSERPSKRPIVRVAEMVRPCCLCSLLALGGVTTRRCDVGVPSCTLLDIDPYFDDHISNKCNCRQLKHESSCNAADSQLRSLTARDSRGWDAGHAAETNPLRGKTAPCSAGMRNSMHGYCMSSLRAVVRRSRTMNSSLHGRLLPN